MSIDLFGDDGSERQPMLSAIADVLRTHGHADVPAEKVAEYIRKLSSGVRSQGSNASRSGVTLIKIICNEFSSVANVHITPWAEACKAKDDMLIGRRLILEHRVRMGVMKRRIDCVFDSRVSGDINVWIEAKTQEGSGSADDKLETVLRRFEKYLPKGMEGWLVTYGNGFSPGALKNAREDARRTKCIKVLDINDLRPHVKRVCGMK